MNFALDSNSPFYSLHRLFPNVAFTLVIPRHCTPHIRLPLTGIIQVMIFTDLRDSSDGQAGQTLGPPSKNYAGPGYQWQLI